MVLRWQERERKIRRVGENKTSSDVGDIGVE
jgi:hypothetical protein